MNDKVFVITYTNEHNGVEEVYATVRNVELAEQMLEKLMQTGGPWTRDTRHEQKKLENGVVAFYYHNDQNHWVIAEQYPVLTEMPQEVLWGV